MKIHRSRSTIIVRLCCLALLPTSSVGFSVSFPNKCRIKTASIRASLPKRVISNHNRIGIHALESSQSEDATNGSSFSTIHPADRVSSRSSRRVVETMDQYPRLPIWPAWNGVVIWLVSILLGKDVAAQLEDMVGGRICPNMFADPSRTSPFVLLVHHRHSFASWDVLRYLQRSFFPEGFPSHPHRGFVTVTYILRGGFRHRDSLGIQQAYGAESWHDGKHTQWLTTGAGILHEEMFDIRHVNFWLPSHQELYQIWINLPSQDKLVPPNMELLGGPNDTPCVETHDSQGRKTTETLVLAGSHGSVWASSPSRSDLTILHVKSIDPGCEWRHVIPPTHETALFYVRKGSVMVISDDVTATTNAVVVPTHTTVVLGVQGTELVLRNDASSKVSADILVLTGVPLREPIAAQGSMVMNSPIEIQEAYRDYQAGKMGIPWKESLSEEEWKVHVRNNPSWYKTKQ
jgi:quercetin 2,3-dioxygenase